MFYRVMFGKGLFVVMKLITNFECFNRHYLLKLRLINIFIFKTFQEKVLFLYPNFCFKLNKLLKE